MAKELVTAFAIMGVCLVIHVLGITLLGEELVRRREKIEKRVQFTYFAALLILVFSVVIVLHLVEALIWAIFYYEASLFANFETSLYFSMESYSTIGYGDVLLPEKWRLLGTVEGISAVLLCGLSAAFLFAIISALFRFRTQRWIREHTEV
jgi:hypothetical protein